MISTDRERLQMGNSLDAALTEFTSLVERVRPFCDLPCVCVPEDDPNDGMTEESIATCARCHAESIFDETMEHARSVVRYIEDMAERRPKVKRRRRAVVKQRDNVVRFQPLSTRRQPDAIWKY